jgi:hypothetical protein
VGCFKISARGVLQDHWGAEMRRKHPINSGAARNRTIRRASNINLDSPAEMSAIALHSLRFFVASVPSNRDPARDARAAK